MVRVRIEVVLAMVLAVVTVVTAVWPTWIEGIFGVDPDGGTGETEWWLVVLFAIATVGVAVIAVRDLRRHRGTADAS